MSLCFIVCAAVSPLLLFFQEEVPPLSGGRTLEEAMVVVASQGVEEEALSGGITKGVGQPMQGIQIFQDPKALKPPTFQNPQFEQTPSPIQTVLPQMGSSTKTLGGALLSKQMSELCSLIIVFNPSSFASPFSLS